MKRVIVVALGVVLMACGGASKSDKKEQSAPSVSASVANGIASGDVVDDVAQMAINFREMAMSAIENDDAKTFTEVMKRREAWLNTLGEEDRAKADASDKQWAEANAERMDMNYEKAVMLNPHVQPVDVASERK